MDTQVSPEMLFTPQTTEQNRQELAPHFPGILARAKKEHTKAMAERVADPRPFGKPWPFEIAERVKIQARGVAGFTKPHLRVTISHDNPQYNDTPVQFDMPDPRPEKKQEVK